MNLWNKIFGKRELKVKAGNAPFPDGGIHYCKKNGLENMNIIFIVDTPENIMVGESPIGTMLVFNYIMDAEYCFSVIVPDSADEVQTKIKNNSGTMVVSGKLSDRDYTSASGEIFCPIIGSIKKMN